MMMQIQQLAELSTVYPEKANISFQELLQGISKETLQKVATYLIGSELFPGSELSNETFIENWFSAGNQEAAQDLHDRLENYKQKEGKDLKIVDIISCLKILQFGLELDEKGELNTKSKEQSEIDLLLAILVSNQEQDANHTKDFDKIEKAFPEDVPAALTLYMQFPVSDILNYNFSDYTYCQIIKSLLLFRFLESTPECDELLQEFYTYFEIEHWKEYMERIIPLISAWSNRYKASSVDIVLKQNDQYEENYAFLKKLTLSDYIKMEDVDYIKIREKPLIELDPFTFRVVHPLFLSDKIYKGLYFLLNQLYQKTSKKLKNFRSWYTSNFSEGVCLREVLQKAFPKPTVLLFDQELGKLGVVGPPDAYLHINDNAFLIENKDILINAAIKGSFDFDVLIAEIKKKLLNEDGRSVGIGQIITNTRKLLSGENKYDPGFNPETTPIYPLLITHDNMFDTIGLNRVLNLLFVQELSVLKTAGLNIANVKPLVVINIDTLIMIQHLLREEKITLSEILEAYHNYSNPGGSGLVSFADFIQNYLNDKLGEWRSQELVSQLFKESDNPTNE